MSLRHLAFCSALLVAPHSLFGRRLDEDQGDPTCWQGGSGYSWDTCCHPRWGSAGNVACWDDHFNFRTCCIGDLQLGHFGRTGLRLQLVARPQDTETLQRWDLNRVHGRLKKFFEEKVDWAALVRSSKVLYLVSAMFDIGSDESVAQRQKIPLRRIRSTADISTDEVRHGVFVPVFESDDDLLAEAEIVETSGGEFRSPFNNDDLELSQIRASRTLGFARSRFLWMDQHARAALAASSRDPFIAGHWSADVHETICQILSSTRHVAGAYVEVGVFKGGSAQTALHYLRLAGIARRIFLFDTFDGFSYDAAYHSFDKTWAGTHSWTNTPAEAINLLSERLKPHVGVGSTLHIQRLNVVEEAIPEQVGAIAAANIDVDLLEATEAALTSLAPHIAVGGMVHCDDVPNTPMLVGALLGMDRFLKSPAGRGFVKLTLGVTVVLIRTSS